MNKNSGTPIRNPISINTNNFIDKIIKQSSSKKLWFYSKNVNTIIVILKL